MNLKEISLRKAHEPMEAWDEATEAFVPNSFLGRIDLTDRFLSNFNKPTRRRMLFADDQTVFPASNVFRHPGTLDVYLLGITRKDAIGGEPYVGLTMCHLVTDDQNGSSGLATITRKLPAGPPGDPGWLVDTQVARCFTDMEFRTSANEPGTTDLKIENYYAYVPRHVQCQAWDFLTLHGKTYRVVDTFADSGLSGLRIDHEEDTRLNFVLHTLGPRTYDQTTHAYTDSPAQFNVTGVLENYNDFSLWVTDTEKYMDVYFEAEHLPFPPEPGKAWLEIDGTRRAVKSVSTQSGQRQYKLRCL